MQSFTRFTVVSTFTAVAAAAFAQDTPAADRLRKPILEERVAPADSTSLSEVVVTADEPEGYTTTEATSATKTDTRLLETPQAVSVVPQKLIKDQGARRLEDVIKNTAGVTPGGYYSEWDYYRIRGFDAAFTTYWDGLRGDYGKNVEIFGVERVEILKGPASSLYGQGPLGGLVNVVSKKPRPENFADVQFTLGMHDFVEPAIDAGLALNDAKTVYLRLNALYRQRDSFVDFVDGERVFIAPSLTWEISPDTKLTILTSYTHDRDHTSMGLPARGTVLPNPNGGIPINRFVGEPDSNEVDQWRVRLGYEFTHRFNEVLSLRQNFSASRLWQDWNDIYYPSFMGPDQRTLFRYPYSTREELDRLAVDTALEARFNTGPIEHYLVGGVDYYSSDSHSTTDQIDYANLGSYAPLDVFAPRYHAPKPPYATTTESTTKSDWWGVYLQEHAKLDRFTLLLGARYDWTSSGDFDAEDFTGRLGMTYEVVKGVALYANYSQSFNPQWFSKDALGNPVEPETGENWEAGIKAELIEGRLTGMISAYHLTRENLATSNLSTPDPFDSIVSGEQRSQGIEVEAAWRITPSWDLTLAYSYTDAEITEDNTLPVGFRLAGVPEHAFSAWMKYTIREGTFKGLGFGIGGRYYSAQQGDQTYTTNFQLPAYGVIDAAISYERGPFHAQINVTNLLDREYYVGAYSDLYVLPGEPLNVRATVGWKF